MIAGIGASRASESAARRPVFVLHCRSQCTKTVDDFRDVQLWERDTHRRVPLLLLDNTHQALRLVHKDDHNDLESQTAGDGDLREAEK